MTITEDQLRRDMHDQAGYSPAAGLADAAIKGGRRRRRAHQSGIALASVSVLAVGMLAGQQFFQADDSMPRADQTIAATGSDAVLGQEWLASLDSGEAPAVSYAINGTYVDGDATYRLPEGMLPVGMSTDGPIVVGRGQVAVQTTPDPASLRTLVDHASAEIRIAPDGGSVMIQDGMRLEVVDVASGEVTDVVTIERVGWELTEWVGDTAVIETPDGQAVWRVGEPTIRPMPDRYRGVSWAPGRYQVVWTGDCARVMDFRSWDDTSAVSGPCLPVGEPDGVQAATTLVSPDGQRVLSGVPSEEAAANGDTGQAIVVYRTADGSSTLIGNTFDGVRPAWESSTSMLLTIHTGGESQGAARCDLAAATCEEVIEPTQHDWPSMGNWMDTITWHGQGPTS